MKIWMSSEAEGQATDRLIEVSNAIEAVLNHALSGIEFNADFEEFAYLAIVMSEKFLPHYPEVVRRSSKKRVLEFRLHVSFNEFMDADDPQKIVILFNSLDRAVDLMTKLKVSVQGQEKFRGILAATREVFERNLPEAREALRKAKAAIRSPS